MKNLESKKEKKFLLNEVAIYNLDVVMSSMNLSSSVTLHCNIPKFGKGMLAA